MQFAIDIWDAESRGVPWDGECTFHASAYDAWRAMLTLKPLCDWAKPAKE